MVKRRSPRNHSKEMHSGDCVRGNRRLYKGWTSLRAGCGGGGRSHNNTTAAAITQHPVVLLRRRMTAATASRWDRSLQQRSAVCWCPGTAAGVCTCGRRSPPLPSILFHYIIIIIILCEYLKRFIGLFIATSRRTDRRRRGKLLWVQPSLPDNAAKYLSFE